MKRYLTLINIAVFILVLAGIIFLILNSEPFLKLPFDPWFHLSLVRRTYEDGLVNYLMWPGNIQSYPAYWHFAWATIFHSLNINDTFMWASIIHKVQSLLAFFSVVFFSFIVLRQLLSNLNKFTVVNLSLIAAVFWTVGFGVLSMTDQQSWLNWYSLTPQALTVSLFWISAALIIQIFYGKSKFIFLIIFGVIIFIFSVVILFLHPLELVYLFIFSLIVFAANFVRLYKAVGIKIVIIPLIFIVIGGLIGYFSVERFGDGDVLLEIQNVTDSLGDGETLKTDKTESVVSEVIIFSLGLGGLFLGFKLITLFIKDLKGRLLDQPYIDFNIFSVIIVASFVFFAIPLIPFISEIVGEFSSTDIVWRFQFGMPWFIIPPVLCYVLFRKLSIELNLEQVKVYLIAGILLTGFYFFSRSQNGLLYKNTTSLRDLYSDSLGVQYSEELINQLSENVEEIKSKNTNKNVIFTVRGDLGYLISAFTGEYVLQSRYETQDLNDEKVKPYVKNGKIEVGGKVYDLIEFPKDKEIPLSQDIKDRFGNLD